MGNLDRKTDIPAVNETLEDMSGTYGANTSVEQPDLAAYSAQILGVPPEAEREDKDFYDEIKLASNR